MTQNSKFPEPKQGQHSRLTLDDAIAQYHNGLLTAAGLIYHAVKIYRQDGHKLAVNVKPFCERLSIKRSTFYSGISKLKTLHDEGKLRFSWCSQGKIVLWIPGEDEIDPHADCEPETAGSQPEPDPHADYEPQSTGEGPSSPQAPNPEPPSKISTPVQNFDTCPKFRHPSKISTPVQNPRQQSKIVDSESTILDSESKILDTRAPKPSSRKGSGTLSNKYQLFINSLSESEREKFLNFVSRSTQNWNPPINDIEEFLAKKTRAGENRWEVYYQKFISSPETQSSRPSGRELLAAYHAELEEQRQRAEKAYQEGRS